MELNSRIYIAGHKGLVGSAILRKLQNMGYNNIITRTSSDLNLIDQQAVEFFFRREKPEYVFMAAARVGGILANNNYPATFIYDNLAIQNNIIHSAYMYRVKKLIFLGSSCIYPKHCSQPIREEYLLTGKLEPTNEPYAIAKIAGITMCRSYNLQYGTDFISVMPTNLYGPGDNFNLESSHVLPALIRKFYEAKIYNKNFVELWGTGKPRREFLHVDDLAGALLFLMNNYSGSDIVNIGTGKDVTIEELAFIIKKITGSQAEIKWDTAKPDGTPRKLLNINKILGLGWYPEIDLHTGIKDTYKWFKENIADNKAWHLC